MNILIVDDEPLIHISIEKLIHTCSKEDAVFHAYNGNQMLEQISEQEFSLAFVDIKMPGPSGLDAIKQAKEISPFTRYYIMTGFNEFEYAKQAIKLKVDDYLMKPLDLKTIQETVTTVRAHVSLSLEHKKSVFRNWLESSLNRRDSYFNEFSGHFCSLMVLNIDTSKILSTEIQHLFLPYDDHLVSVFTEDGLMLLGFSKQSEYLLEMHRDLSAHSYPRGVTCFASSITTKCEELKSALAALSDRCCLRVIFGLGNFFHLAPFMNVTPAKLDFCHNCLKWQSAYISRDYSSFTNQSDLIVSQLSALTELEKYRDHVLDFLALTLDVSKELLENPSTLREQFSLAAKAFLSSLTETSKVQSIIQFIQEHYQENISAGELSERFNLSANYISILLKNALGIRYNDYVTQLRLNRAKELLVSTRLSVKEITVECGYFSQSHFTKLFLEYENCTPLEYRKTNGSPLIKSN